MSVACAALARVPTKGAALDGTCRDSLDSFRLSTTSREDVKRLMHLRHPCTQVLEIKLAIIEVDAVPPCTEPVAIAALPSGSSQCHPGSPCSINIES